MQWSEDATVPLWRSYLAGCIFGVAPCTAMVLVWGYLARGNDGLTVVMVALNSLTMLVLYGVLGGFLLGVGRLPVPCKLSLCRLVYMSLCRWLRGIFLENGFSRPKAKPGLHNNFSHCNHYCLAGDPRRLFSLKGD